MPFGLRNAPATFERLVERILKRLRCQTCLVYLDDIIVMARTFFEHLKNLGEALHRITTAELKVSVKKYALFQKQVKYLGHLVTADVISTDNDKIRAVKDVLCLIFFFLNKMHIFVANFEKDSTRLLPKTVQG